MLGDGYFMIPIKELKINNLAFTNLRTKEVGRISEIRQNIITGQDKVKFEYKDKTYYADTIHPIEITEMVLIRNGWKIDYAKDDLICYVNDKLDIDNINYVKSKNLFYWNCWENTKFPKYIHEFQNFYFSITGRDLTIA